MLQLQRASAGSGKTYTLTKKFIQYLLAEKREDGTWRVRHPREIAEELPRILAITFTNKATNEMKQRIVEKLADMARADGSTPLTEKELGEIAYLRDFAKSLKVSTEELGKGARSALKTLLNNYSDFKVSTIDSFFQTVLRTFAYESNLNDSYQVEIDSEFVASESVDATLRELNIRESSKSRAAFWLNCLIDKETEAGGHSWNVFQRKDKKGTIYSNLKQAVQRLENEDYKEIREKTDDYFNSGYGTDDPLINAYKRARAAIEQPMKEALGEAKREASRLKGLFREFELDIATDGAGYLAGRIEKIGRIRYNQTVKTDIFPAPAPKSSDGLKKTVKTDHADEINETAQKMYAAYGRWTALREAPEWKHWCLYAPLIPYLGLIREVRDKMRDFLEDNNSIQLGETNSMLRRIIGEDDAPFIYERMGSVIDHYLIDEFQDTSKLQWDNLRPLVRESDSRGEDNLIIGDAKQSIYRFRNADSTLIDKAVPKEFRDCVKSGTSKEENTNWRSDRTIVEFNNTFFEALSSRMASLEKGTTDIIDIYGNVAQFPHKRAREGYVEVNFLGKDEDTGQTPEERALERIGPLVSSLLERGYRQRDIAFLVANNALGKSVIASLVKYNGSLPAGAKRIEFISEESLLVSSSQAVGIIMTVLEKMASGTDIRHDDGDPQRSSWSDIRCNVSFYAMSHPELTPAQQIENYLKEQSPDDAISKMLSEMQTVALPALVEAITEKFVPEELRRSQAVFIAALQDLVIEYCERSSSDIPSFLSWWKTKGVGKSISSPEGTDAVQVMTIHKSKGLEFKCVILPFHDPSMTPTDRITEWKWVAPAKCLSEFGLPPYLPVETESKLDGTEHTPVWNNYFNLVMMDKLNAAYVAFTRAVDELYVFTSDPGDKDTGTKFSHYLHSICRQMAEEGTLDLTDPGKEELLLPQGTGRWDIENNRFTVGTPLDKRQTKGDEAEKTNAEQHVVEEYNSDSSPAILHYVESPDEGGETPMPDAADTDPRSEGNLLHAIMENVRVASDLHNAVLTLKMRGLLTAAQAEEWEPMLEKAMSTEPASGWFDPSWEVLNERSIILPHSPMARPDRIMLSADRRSAVIVDYKFGAVPEGNAHIKQVSGYVKDLQSALGIARVSGFIWYVRAGNIVAV